MSRCPRHITISYQHGNDSLWQLSCWFFPSRASGNAYEVGLLRNHLVIVFLCWSLLITGWKWFWPWLNCPWRTKSPWDKRSWSLSAPPKVPKAVCAFSLGFCDWLVNWFIFYHSGHRSMVSLWRFVTGTCTRKLYLFSLEALFTLMCAPFLDLMTTYLEGLFHTKPISCIFENNIAARNPLASKELIPFVKRLIQCHTHVRDEREVIDLLSNCRARPMKVSWRKGGGTLNRIFYKESFVILPLPFGAGGGAKWQSL